MYGSDIGMLAAGTNAAPPVFALESGKSRRNYIVAFAPLKHVVVVYGVPRLLFSNSSIGVATACCVDVRISCRRWSSYCFCDVKLPLMLINRQII